MNLNKKYNIHIYFIAIILIMFIFENFYRELFLKELSLTQEAIPKLWQFITYAFYTGLTITQMGFSQLNVLWFIFHVLIAYWFGRMLEYHLGSFKFLIFIMLTILGESIVVYILGPNNLIRLFGIPIYFRGLFHLSFMLMFGITYPKETIYLFFIIQVRVLYLAIFYYLWYLFGLYQIWNRDFIDIIMILSIFAGSSLGIIVFNIKKLLINKIKKRNIAYFKEKKEKKSLQNGEKDYEYLQKIKNKLESNKSLSSKEEKYLESLYKINIEKEICSKDDFEPESDFCKSCENYKICVRRYLEDIHSLKNSL